MRKLFGFIVLLAILFSISSPASAQSKIQVYYSGPKDGITTAIQLSGEVNLVDQIDQADVLVINGSLPAEQVISSHVKNGAGLVWIFGPDTTARQVSELTGAAVDWKAENSPLSLTPVGNDDPLLQQIIWTSAPQVRERYQITNIPGYTTLVKGYEDKSMVLGHGQLGQGQAFLFSAFLDGANPQIQEWAYYNYFIYALVVRAAGRTPWTFGAYPGSPVPHAPERVVLLALMIGLVVLSLVLFFFVRRYSLAHPEILDEVVSNQIQFIQREATTRWEEVGFHRPLGGFLLALMLGLVMFIPIIIYQNLILPTYILPSGQALGIWGRVVQFFNLAWQFFDMGTSVAFIKYLSQYRVHDPRRAIQFGQVFVWWQAISGAIQVAMVIALATVVVPHTAYAIYAWSVIIHAMIQIPGFYQVFRHAFTGFQRFDYAQIIDMLAGAILAIVFQPVVVSLMYLWGKSHPIFGPSMAGLLGMGIAAYLIELCSFIIGYWLYHRLGYNMKTLFLAHFDWGVVVESFRFGVFEMLGSIAWAAGQAGEIWITQSRLINYAEIWGNWGLAQNFIYSYQVLSTLFNNLMPSISESFSQGCRVLTQYYEVQAYKYGGLISAFIGAVLLAVADRFILGSTGPEFVRAAEYSIPLIIWGAIQYPSWVGDNIQLAVNRPYLKSLLILGEQTGRVVLALILVGRYQINGLIIAYFICLFGKDFTSYFVNNKVCFPHRFYVWQSLAAPILAGGLHYILLRWLTGLFWHGDQVSSVLIFLFGILFSFPVFTFLYGLFGGWDDATLEELHCAVPLTSFMQPMAWLFWASTALGAHLSPLHNRFPITIRAEALNEARQLTMEKVGLV
jgi:O-antigen/teichoic acid export membrane protein